MRADLQTPVTSRENRPLRQNAGFGIAYGALLVLGHTLIHPVIVLALYVSLISDSYLLVGLVPALATGVAVLPLLFGAGSRPGLAGGRATGVWAGIIRAAAIGLLGTAGFALGDGKPQALLLTFFITYAVYNLASGFANTPMVDITAHFISADRLSRVLGQRTVWGAVMGVVVGYTIARLLGDGEDAPATMAILFLLAFVALSLAAYVAAMVREPHRGDGHVTSLGHPLSEAPHLLDNDYFRRFLAFRAFLSLSAIADPFYVVFAYRQLGVPIDLIGLYVAALTVGRFAANLIWEPLAARRSNRLVLQMSALLRMTIPLLVLALPPLLRWSVIADRGLMDGRTLAYAFTLVFVVYGVSLSGQALANMAYLLDIAPEAERPAYSALLNAVLAVVAFVPLVGGLLLERFGFQFLFLVAFLIGFAAVLSSGALHEPRFLRPTPLLSRYDLLTRSRRARG